MQRRMIAKLLCGTVLGGVLAATAAPAIAQDEEETDDVVIVTGSRLNQANLASPSPVTTVESELFDLRGTVDTIDLINTLPQTFAAQTTAFANGANGTSTINLRGLGSTRTLVLIDGKRLPPGSPTGGFAADVNLVPAQLVERVEIVTGGASAVYGSDAVGGVANFILRKDFEGFEIDGLFGFNQSNNSTQLFEDALLAIGEDPVQGSVTDNPTYDISGVAGADLGDGRGNVTGYFRYLRNDGIQQGDRDFARCAGFSGTGPTFSCIGSNQGPFPTTFFLTPAVDGDGNMIGLVDENGNPLDANEDGEQDTGGAFSVNAADDTLSAGFTNAFNFNPDNPIRRSVERFNAGFSGYYSVTDTVEAYMDFGFTQSNSPQIIAPSAAFGSAINQVNCDNPLLTAEQRAIICGNASIDGPFPRDVDGDGFAQSQVRRRVVESGPRTDDRTLTNFRVVGGFRGTLSEVWDWDVFGQFANTNLARIQNNQVTATQLERSLDIVTDPDTGAPVCRSVIDGTDPSCIPFTSAFQIGVPSDPGLGAYLDTPSLTQGSSQQTVFGGTIAGDLGNYGISSPWADEGISILLGTEYRRDQLQNQADATNQQGLLVGAGAPFLPTNGRTDVYEFFFETSIPLISGRTFFEELNITGAFRRSEYSAKNILTGESGGDFGTNTFAAGLAWVPVEDIRLRAQFQRAVRSPNTGELFAPINTGLTGLNDPCSGSNPTASEAACENTGVLPGQFGFIPPDSGQLNTLGGGNPDLTPETGDTFTVGAVVQPRWIEGLTISADYFNIEVSDIVGTLPTNSILNGCLDTGSAFFCDLITRSPNDGSLTDDAQIAFIEANAQNIASLETTGIDFQVLYDYDLNEYGGLRFNYNATWLWDLTTTEFEGQASYNCVGFFDSSCGNPNFGYRHNLQMVYSTPFNIRASFLWRYLSGVDRISDIDLGATADGATGEIVSFQEDGLADALDARLGSVNYLDVALFWDATEYATLRIGANNVFDNDPPIIPTFNTTVNNEANTAAGVFDAGGRFIFVGVNLRF